MTDPADGEWRGRRGAGRGSDGERRKPSLAERREARAAETDPEVVLAAAARFLEVRPRSVAEVRRRLRSAGLRSGSGRAARSSGSSSSASWTTRLRPGVGESRDRARPRGERALRVELRQKGVGREETDEALEGRRDEAEAAARASGEGEDGTSADEAAAERLLARRASQLGRVPDPRRAPPARATRSSPAMASIRASAQRSRTVRGGRGRRRGRGARRLSRMSRRLRAWPDLHGETVRPPREAIQGRNRPPTGLR